MMMARTLSLSSVVAASLLALALAPIPAWAGTVKGVVHLADDANSTRLYQGYWRLENGNVPVQSSGGAKAETVVVLEVTKDTHAPAARTVTVEIGGLDARPRLVVLGPGSVVELKNTGKVTHEFSTPDNPSFMPVERLTPGTFRRQKFTIPGGYLIRCAEYPHIAISAIVVASPFFGTLDEKGNFTIPDVPDGKAILKVWTRGRWAHEQEIDTTRKDALSIKVSAPKGSKETKDNSAE
jgi:plastocyanin